MLQEIEIKDLEAGDEILISCQSYFKYLRLLRTPQLGKKLHWRTKLPMYKSVKCSARVDETKHTYNTRTWIEKKWLFTDHDHNNESYVNLEYRQILLIKKNTN